MEKVVQDEALDSLGIPTAVDTIDVCQTWTGADYYLRLMRLGGTDVADARLEQGARGSEHKDGYLTQLNPDGSAFAAPVEVGTWMSSMNLDSTTVATLETDPYFNIRAVAPCEVDPEQAECASDTTSMRLSGARLRAELIAVAPSCTRTAHIDCTPLEGVVIERDARSTQRRLERTAATGAIARDGAGRFGRHRLRAPALARLLESAVEEGGANGERSFRGTIGGEEHRWVLDAATELVVREEVRGSDHTRRMSNQWRRVPGGWVRTGSESVVSEIDARGRRFTTFERLSVYGLRLR